MKRTAHFVIYLELMLTVYVFSYIMHSLNLKPNSLKSCQSNNTLSSLALVVFSCLWSMSSSSVLKFSCCRFLASSQGYLIGYIRGGIKSIYTELVLYGSTNECAMTDTVFFPISHICTRGVTLSYYKVVP